MYNGMAAIYDRMIEIDYDAWMSFVKDIISKHGKRLAGLEVLEMACGTGNMTERLVNEGAKVTAFDYSEEMLQEAEAKFQRKRNRAFLLKQDLKSFRLSKAWDAVFCFCDGYNYLLDDSSIVGSFKRVYDGLNGGGLFIFDISTSYKLKALAVEKSYSYVKDDLCYIWDNYIDDDIISMYITFFIKEGELYRRVNETQKQRAYETEFVREGLIKAGFNKIDIYDGYTDKPVSHESSRAVFVCTKEDKR